eukprot:Skav207673  [mRNA]  locus=scaffold1857:336969:337697:+ [translate_table: standard]
MIGPPKTSGGPGPAPLDKVVAQPRKPKDFLPGLPLAGGNAMLHSSGAKDSSDNVCTAAVVKGGRCRRKRLEGSNFCKQHLHEMSKPERQAAVWEMLEDRITSAAERWEKEHMNMAAKLSLEQSDQLMEQIRKNREKISRKLKKRDLEVAETAKDGSRQYLAALYSAGIEMDEQQFRTQVVQYLRSISELFKDQMQTTFRSFSDYCHAMARPDGRGDDLTLTCIPHLLLRPIVCSRPFLGRRP